jgi:hypothetical protein
MFAIWMMQAARIPFHYNLIGWPAGPESPSGWGGMYISPFGGWVMPINIPEPKDVFMIFEEYAAWFGDDWEGSKAGGTKEWAMERIKDYNDLRRINEFDMLRRVSSLHGLLTEWPMGSIVIDIVQNGYTVAQAVEKWGSFAQNEVYRVFRPDMFRQDIVDAMEDYGDDE